LLACWNLFLRLDRKAADCAVFDLKKEERNAGRAARKSVEGLGIVSMTVIVFFEDGESLGLRRMKAQLISGGRYS
jgi:hypothetical protein